MKLFIALLTGIGGHYLNRRWDKAILFFCLFLLYPFLVYAVFIVNLSSGGYQSVKALQQDFSLIFCGGVTLLWFVSFLITWSDTRHPQGSSISRWTFSGVIGAVTTSLLTSAYFIFAGFLLVNSFELIGSQGESAALRDNAVYQSDVFYGHTYFGGSSGSGFTYPEPPSGDGVLRGRITFKGKPAAGVQLSIDLNDKYRASGLVTDADGIFQLSLKPGTWFINSLQTRSWTDKPPEGEFSLFYDGQPKLQEGKFDRYANLGSSGYRVEVTEQVDQPHLNIRIGRNLVLSWPDPEIEKNRAKPDDVIRWQAHPEAVDYYLVVNHLTRNGDTTTYAPITERLLHKQTELPLTELAHAPSDGETEYSVQVYAFAADGTLIGESSSSIRKGSFVLDSGQRLVKDDKGFAAESEEEREAYIARMKAEGRNRVLLEAIEVLLMDQRLVEAQPLFALVESEGGRGKKEVFQGHYYALQGECGKAQQAFDRALEINPEVCIPAKYREACQ